ncbi:uncharacterized protein LOC131953757 [Physella acuta]|uniref:uncharacterized protein LOC131953757 n=1 Tax=Physella acuta TaxID=109671 RepID=UPI0027DAD029|nr:uncharacterized protein LOC131953757 [Physella acuta]
MHISQCLLAFIFAVCVTVTVGEYEVYNDVTTDEPENIFENEELIPVDVLAKMAAKANRRSLRSVSNEQEGHGATSTTKTQAAKVTQPKPSSTAAKTTTQSKFTKVVQVVQDAKEKSDDTVDLASEGFLAVQEKAKSGTSRKLAEVVVEDSSEQIEQESVQVDVPVSHENDDSLKPETLKAEPEEPYKSLDGNPDNDRILAIACQDQTSWACLVFKEDYMAMKKTWNLSEDNIAKLRKKRQVTSPPKTTSQNRIAEGSGTVYDPEKKVVAPDIIVQSQTKFKINSKNPNNDAIMKKLQEQLSQQLNQAFRDFPGFKGIEVTEYTQQNGEVIAKWNLKLDGNNTGSNGNSNSLFSQGNQTILEDLVNGLLKNASNNFRNIFNIPELEIQDPFLPNLAQLITNATADPCSSLEVCEPGYTSCQVEDAKTRTVTCFSECSVFTKDKQCAHNGECELDLNHKPYCACTSKYEGEYCEKLKKVEKLDAGEISGVVIGAVVAAAGVVGCCFWVLACRKSDKNIAFSHYSDDNGSDQFSSPSSKLSAFVIDRPHISVNPIQVFRPTPPSSAGSPPASTGGSHRSVGRQSSLGSIESGPPRAPKGKQKYPYSKA